MHNREITHIVKTDGLSKTQLIVRTKCSVGCHFERNLCQNLKKVCFYENTMHDLDLRL